MDDDLRYRRPRTPLAPRLSCRACGGVVRPAPAHQVVVAMTDFRFEFRAKIRPTSQHPDGVIDGDTIDVTLDRAFGDRSDRRLRLAHVNTPERRGGTLAAGDAAREVTRRWLAARTGDWPLLVTTLVRQEDVFGRVLAEVRDAATGESLGEVLLREGAAVPFEG